MYTPHGNCINCENFTWWDGDYCCLKKMLILQSSPNGEFNDDILRNMKYSDNCMDYTKTANKSHEIYETAFNEYVKK